MIKNDSNDRVTPMKQTSWNKVTFWRSKRRKIRWWRWGRGTLVNEPLIPPTRKTNRTRSFASFVGQSPKSIKQCATKCQQNKKRTLLRDLKINYEAETNELQNKQGKRDAQSLKPKIRFNKVTSLRCLYKILKICWIICGIWIRTFQVTITRAVLYTALSTTTTTNI